MEQKDILTEAESIIASLIDNKTISGEQAIALLKAILAPQVVEKIIEKPIYYPWYYPSISSPIQTNFDWSYRPDSIKANNEVI